MTCLFMFLKNYFDNIVINVHANICTNLHRTDTHVHRSHMKTASFHIQQKSNFIIVNDNVENSCTKEILARL